MSQGDKITLTFVILGAVAAYYLTILPFIDDGEIDGGTVVVAWFSGFLTFMIIQIIAESD